MIQDNRDLAIDYRLSSENMFIESDLFFRFAIREVIRHSSKNADLSVEKMATLLEDEIKNLLEETN